MKKLNRTGQSFDRDNHGRILKEHPLFTLAGAYHRFGISKSLAVVLVPLVLATLKSKWCESLSSRWASSAICLRYRLSRARDRLPFIATAQN